MKECPRCFFLNPDHAEFCIKCRFHIGSIYGNPSVSTVEARGWSSPSQGTGARSIDETAPRDTAPGEGPAGPDAAAIQAQESVPKPVEQDLRKEFEGRTFYEVGGYRLGGTPADPLDAPPIRLSRGPCRRRAETKKKESGAQEKADQGSAKAPQRAQSSQVKD